MFKTDKYPRIMHFPFSPGATNDDRIAEDGWFDAIKDRQLVYLEKLDGSNCLGEDTILITEIGKKTIQWICENKYNGKVLCYNVETGQSEFKKILDWFITEFLESDDWFSIECESGDTLLLTGEHYVWLPDLNCYRRVKNLTENDIILINTEK